MLKKQKIMMEFGIFNPTYQQNTSPINKTYFLAMNSSHNEIDYRPTKINLEETSYLVTLPLRSSFSMSCCRELAFKAFGNCTKMHQINSGSNFKTVADK